jgi:hypothetical protein
MLDTSSIEQLIKTQITDIVNNQVAEVLTDETWLLQLEEKIIKYAQAQISRKLFSEEVPPEILSAIESSITRMFEKGYIPGIDNYLDASTIAETINQTTEKNTLDAIEPLINSPAWQQKAELLITQATVQKTMSTIGTMDINTVIHERVDENMDQIRKTFMDKFSSTGIDDCATSCQLTVMDENTVIENTLTVQALESMSHIRTGDLIVTGSINTDNKSWNELSESLSEKTLAKLGNDWKDKLVSQVAQKIQDNGVDFKNVTIDGELFFSGDKLTTRVKRSSIESVGTLHNLTVKGATSLNETMSVVRGRVGINTKEPEMVLSVWDEEINVTVGKFKSQQAWIGTSRNQGLTIGVNRLPQIELDADGLTKIKKLQVGLHKIQHDVQVPGWSGSKGDIVFNANFSADRVFAWVCLGGYKWQTLKSAE